MINGNEIIIFIIKIDFLVQPCSALRQTHFNSKHHPRDILRQTFIENHQIKILERQQCLRNIILIEIHGGRCQMAIYTRP